ncbi:hypothetical protein [Nocardia alni]|uniref:hypothetical protein n=1 Tax=Nocardia alni TaxID=2815723 RepID=UPI001C249DAD|nr:hypothetical protein [Nocardia alni]
MTDRPIIDAGPGLSFFSINKERLLIRVLGPISAPECVRDEILRKARQQTRFKPSEIVVNKLSDRWLRWLSDDVTDELAAAVQRICGLPMEQRLRGGKDLGETMVVAHAVVAAEAGAHVTVLIDDGAGARAATKELKRLDRIRKSASVGSITLVNTATVLEKAVTARYIEDRGELKEIYQRLRDLDDGLMPIDRTALLRPELWNSRSEGQDNGLAHSR